MKSAKSRVTSRNGYGSKVILPLFRSKQIEAIMKEKKLWEIDSERSYNNNKKLSIKTLRSSITTADSNKSKRKSRV